MRPPRILPLVTDIVQSALEAFNGIGFTECSRCPACGGPVSGYDTRLKRFVVMRSGEQERIIMVRVKRFTCKECKRLCYADEPFYPGTRIGSLVIDLYFTLSSTMSGSRAARVLNSLGIIVNRTTWRNYRRDQFPDIPAGDFFGMRLPYSVITLSALAARTPEGGSIEGAEALAACGFPSAHRAGPDLPPPAGKKGDDRNEKEEKEKR